MQRKNERHEDWLLQRFSAKGSEAAFAELVSRHLDFVYSVCRRQVGDPELAQDITQTVFLALAAKSGSLKPGTVLSGWLFQTALNACRNALRSETRRQHYEQKAAEEMEHGTSLTAGSMDGEMPQIEPVLDDALAQLSAADRNAVLLRYGDELSPEEVGAALGISAAAAQKRVSRALKRLRCNFAKTGTVLSVAAGATFFLSLYLTHFPALLLMRALLNPSGNWQPDVSHLLDGLRIALIMLSYAYAVSLCTERQTANVRRRLNGPASLARRVTVIPLSA